ncbi:MAG: hypothetical protein ACM3PT_05705 [Deltaproteobacteria bacterium]
MEKIFETTGYTIKEENVDFLNHHVLANTMVINVSHPFPGFYGTPVMEESKPRAVILVTKEKYSWEKILRTVSNINKFTDYKINGTYARVSLGNIYFEGIRIRGLNSYDEIPIIQHAFQEEGFRFMNARKYKDDQTVAIKLSKFYKIQQVAESIYLDMDTEHIHYILIPHQLNWELFRSITMKIKNNISNRNFDVVSGVFFMDKTVKDMIRVFKPGISLELLSEIKEKYYKEIERYF